MNLSTRKTKFYFFSFLRHDLNASITVFFVALPLCLGISLASGAPVYSGLIAGIIGGIVISFLSGSQLSVSGPAAGLTAICVSAISDLGAIEIFFLTVAIAGVIQILLGAFKLGGFTHFIPSTVIKGMLAAIGVLLISKQVPLLIGYNKPDFWRNELFNILTFNHGFEHITSLYESISWGPIIVAATSIGLSYLWQRTLAKKVSFLPSTIIIVIAGSLSALALHYFLPSIALRTDQYVQVPSKFINEIKFPDFSSLFKDAAIWKYSVLICFVASLETLLSIEAIDKLDPFNRITPQNRELMAQGTGNLISGLIGGLPITAVIVRSSANAEAGGRTRLSSFAHGIWLLVAIFLATPLINAIPYSVLAVILFRTGYNLAKPKMIKAVYKQGREQFLPFIVTVIAILFTDLLIGVLIGVVYSIYFLVKHTYRAGFIIKEKTVGHNNHIIIELALNVSFLNKKRFMVMLDKIPAYSIVEINGNDSVYIDHDILEIITDFKSKAHLKHIELNLLNIPEVESIELH